MQWVIDITPNSRGCGLVYHDNKRRLVCEINLPVCIDGLLKCVGDASDGSVVFCIIVQYSGADQKYDLLEINRYS